jgi:transposase
MAPSSQKLEPPAIPARFSLIAKLDAARQRLAKLSGRVPKVILCYEAGYDGFWLARFLHQRGIDCRVMDPASLQVDPPPAHDAVRRRIGAGLHDLGQLFHLSVGEPSWAAGTRTV